MGRGRFITFEGTEGSGKSTQMAILHRRLAVAKWPVVATREPGGTTLGERLRAVVLDRRCAILPAAEALLFAAARAQLVGEVLEPALRRGAVVLCDRFVDSSLAYQAGGRGLPLGEVRAIQRLAVGGVEPDLRILLDLPESVGLQRRLGEPSQVNRLDDEDGAFHARVRAMYHRLVGEAPDRWLVVDAARSEGEVATAIWEGVSHVLGDDFRAAPAHGSFDGGSR